MRRLGALFLFFAAVSVNAQNLRVDVTPAVSIPLSDSRELFGTAFGADLSGMRSLANPLLSVGGAVGYRFVDVTTDTPMSVITFGGITALRQLIGNVIGLEAGAQAGVYVALYGDDSDINPYIAPFAGSSFSLSPSFDLYVGARYDAYFTMIDGEVDTLFDGVGASVGFRLAPASSGSFDPNLEIAPPQLRPIFPVLFRYYDENELGEVSVTNSERGRIEDVELSFYVRQYMDAPKLSVAIDELDRGESISIPIYALFEDSVLSITEGTSVNAQIQVAYTYRGRRMETVRSQTLQILDRNSIRWDDDRKAAAFVTSKDTNVLRLSRAVASVVRESESRAFSTAVRSAIGVFDALNILGVSYVVDPQSSYSELSENGTAIDYVQFPSQTLEFGSGDCDDLSVLYAALLESIGVRTAFITTPGHIFLAFDTGLSVEDARYTFSDTSRFIEYDEQAWIPVEITLVERDFSEAWNTGLRQWREAVEAGVAAFYPVQEAWQVYEPTGFEGSDIPTTFPQPQVVRRTHDATLDELVRREIGPQVERIEDRLARSPNDARLLNRLGTIYARYGLLSDARQAFERAIRVEENGPALINLGNLEYLNNDHIAALRYYQRAQIVLPDDPTVHLSVARAQYELEQYRVAEANYEVAADLDSDIVADFAYIVQGSNGTGRAASTESRELVIWSESDEEG